MDAYITKLNDILRPIVMDPQLKPLLVLMKAARNGAVYGTKVRFPHALVMIFLFRSGTLREKLKAIFKATRTHARNLALFAFLYKASMLALSAGSNGSQSKQEASLHSLLAGLIGGYTVFGRGIQSSVNQQIVIYVFARVVLAGAKLAVKENMVCSRETGEMISKNAWPVFAAVNWGLVMWLFRWYPEMLQPSLRSSMVYIYDNADTWDGLRNFLIVNK